MPVSSGDPFNHPVKNFNVPQVIEGYGGLELGRDQRFLTPSPRERRGLRRELETNSAWIGASPTRW